MKAHVIENGVVTNTIIVDSLDFLPNLVEATEGGIGWTYVNGVFTPPPDTRTPEQKAEEIRIRRDQLLAATDWTQAADVPQAIKDKYAAYRQALRDVPQQPGFPDNIQWPVKPE